MFPGPVGVTVQTGVQRVQIGSVTVITPGHVVLVMALIYIVAVI